jgi:phage terminase large subunit
MVGIYHLNSFIYADVRSRADPTFSYGVQSAGAASIEIEAIRRILPRCWFNKSTIEPGSDALGYYDERKDEMRNVGLGLEHDWSSHAARAFGLMAICYEEPRSTDGSGPCRMVETFCAKPDIL